MAANFNLARNVLLALAVILAWATPQAMAQTYYWDVSTNSGIQNGNGTWGTDNFWASTTAGTNNVAWSNNATAWLGGTSVAGQAGTPSGDFTITVSGTQITAGIRQIQNGAGNFTLEGGELQGNSFRVDTNTLTINSVIGSYTNVANARVDFSAQPVAGAGTLLILGGNNTLTNNVGIAGSSSGGGTVRLNHQNALGLGNSVHWVHNSLLDLNGYSVSGKTITVSDQRTAQIVNSGASNAVWSGNVVLTNTVQNVGFRAGGTNGEVEFTGVISGTSNNSVQSYDGGRLRLSGTNTYDGVTSVRDNSTLIVNNNSALGSTVSGTTIGTGATLDLNGFNVGSEAVTLQTATSKLVNNNASSAANVSGNISLQTSGSATREIGGAGDLTLGGVISGNNAGAGFTKVGAGTLTLSGANTYAGGTTVSAGTLALSGSGTLGATTNALTISGGNVDLGGLSRNVGAFTLSTGTLANGTLTATNYALTNAGSISASLAGSGGLTKSGAGTATLSGSNSYSGTTTTSAGSLRVNNANALGSGTSVHYTATSTLDLNGFDVSGKTITASSGATGILDNTSTNKSAWSGTVDLSSGTGTLRAGGTGAEVEISGVISGTNALQSLDNGVLRLSGDNTYTGGTSLRSGSTLIVGHTNALGLGSATTFIGSGTLDLNGFDIGNKTIRFQQNTSRLVNDNTTNAAVLSGTVEMQDNRNNSQIGGAGNLTLSGNIALILTGSPNGGGGFTKVGTGALTLSGSNNYTGTTTLSAGTLRVGSDNALGTGGFTISDSTVLASADANARTIANAITMGGNAQFGDATGTGALTLSNINLGTATRTFTVSNNTTVAGAITNTGGLTKQGTGTLRLSGGNSYDGVTIIANGVLRLSHSNGLGSTIAGTVVADGAQLRLFGGTPGATSYGNGEALTISGDGGGTNSYNGALRSGLSGETNTYGGKVTLADNATINAGSGTGLILDVASGDAVDLGANTLTFLGQGTHAVNDGIVGSGGIIKSGTGTVTLAASNSYSGTTVLNEGSIVLSGAGRLGSGDIALNTNANRVLEFAVTGTNVMANNIGGAGRLLSSSGETRFTGTVTNTGGLTITDSTVRIGNGGTSGSVSGPITNNASLVFDRSDFYTNSATISGSGSVTQAGAGTTTITNANTYTGGTTISAGTLQFVNGGSVAGNVTNNAALAINRTDTSTLSNIVSGTGSLTKAGAGTLTLTALNSYSGGTFLDGGWLVAGHTNAFGTGSITVGSGTTLNLTNFNIANVVVNNGGTILSTGTLDDVIATNGTTDIGGNNSTIEEIGGTAVVNVTGSSVVVSNATGGTLNADGSNVQVASVSGGTVNLGGGSAVVTAASGGTVNANASGATLGSVSGTAAVNVAGANARVATLSGGSVAANASGLVVTNYNGGNIAVSNGVTVGLRGGSSSGVISGQGGIAKQGADTLTLSGVNTLSGATTVEEGKLVVNGSLSSATTVQSGATLGGSGTVASAIIESGGTIGPGNSPGTITFTNGLTWLGGGNYDWQIFAVSGTAGATNTWDLISVTGGTWDITGLSSGNKFNINLWSLSGLPETSGPLAGFNASTNYSWKILDASAISGSFNTNLFNINTSAVNGTGGFVGASGLFSLAMDENNDLFLNYAPGGEPIPEPGTWAAAALLALGAAYVRRRRKKEALAQLP